MMYKQWDIIQQHPLLQNSHGIIFRLISLVHVPTSEQGHTYIMTIVDVCTGYVVITKFEEQKYGDNCQINVESYV